VSDPGLQPEGEGPDEAAVPPVPATPVPETPTPVQPTMRERLRPLELLGMSAGLAVFAGVITMLVLHPWGNFATHAEGDWLTIGVVFGVAFIVSLVVLAMLSIGGYEAQQPPSPKGVLVDNEERQDRGLPPAH